MLSTTNQSTGNLERKAPNTSDMRLGRFMLSQRIWPRTSQLISKGWVCILWATFTLSRIQKLEGISTHGHFPKFCDKHYLIYMCCILASATVLQIVDCHFRQSRMNVISVFILHALFWFHSVASTLEFLNFWWYKGAAIWVVNFLRAATLCIYCRRFGQSLVLLVISLRLGITRVLLLLCCQHVKTSKLSEFGKCQNSHRIRIYNFLTDVAHLQAHIA